jgi:peptidoglycan hydrolase-like protein with peptidoglycan-binding domain
MKTRVVVAAGMLLVALTATQVSAQAAADVERAQKTLKEMGHDPGPIDGVMGAQTSAALKAYQKKNGLDVTGQLDAATAARLGEAAPAASPAAPPRGGDAQTGGDEKPNAVDPAQATKTGANAGEGASYSRSQEKGQSTTK